MGFLNNIFVDGNAQILFFILVFLLLFNGNLFGKWDGEGYDGSQVLFFIILFLLLFFNDDGVREEVN